MSGSTVLVDAAGRRRSPATLRGYLCGRAPRNKGMQYGLRISEALALSETDVDERRGSLLIRHGKGDKRREAGMDDWDLSSSAGLNIGLSCRSDRCSA
jgi:hypothetical protein